MSRWPPALTDSLEPRPDEIHRLRPPPAPGWCADATTPEDVEVDRLLAHTSRSPAPTRRPRAALAWALVAALLLLGVLHLAPLPGDPPPAGAGDLAQQGVLHFGPSITVSGAGEIELIRSDEQGTELALLAGSATFEVDPAGERRHLEVHAGAVRVEVTGTRFTVAIHQGRVRVEVLRGSVNVHRPGDSLSLRAGEDWSGVDSRSKAEQVPATPPEAGEPSTEIPVTSTEIPTPSTEGLAELPAAKPPTPTLPPRGGEGSQEAPHQSAAQAWVDLLVQRATLAEPEAQLQAVEDFLATHDDPVLTAEAEALRLDLLATLLPGEEVLPELDAWLADHPDHPRSLEIELLRATVAREQLDDCVLALPSYTRVAREASGPLQAHARAWAEHCRGVAR